MFVIFITGMNMSIFAQESLSENPRGVYKLIDFVGKGGKTFEPSEEQYKICTDSVTVTLMVKGDNFEFSLRDGKKVFNYTGEEPDTSDPHASRIYESNAQRFSVKWWSHGYYDRPLFPERDWCIEHYETDKFSEAGKAIIDAFMSTDYKDDSNPLIGVWNPVGTVKNIHDEEEVKRVAEETQRRSETSEANVNYCIMTPSLFINSAGGRGKIASVDIRDKDSFQIGSSIRKVTWLSLDTIAVELQQGRTVVWTRANRGQSLFTEMQQPKPSYKSFFLQYLAKEPEAVELLREDADVLKSKFKKMSQYEPLYEKEYIPYALADELSSLYIKSDYWIHMSNVLAEYSRKYFSLADIQQLNAMYEKKQARLACEKLTKVKERMRYEVLPGIILNFVASNGVLMEPIAVDCSENYQKLFDDYFRKSNIEQVMMRSFEVLLEGMDKKDLNKCKKALPVLSSSMRVNIPVLLRNACLDTMTEEDLKELIVIAGSPVGMAASEMNRAFAEDMSHLFTKKETNEVVALMRSNFFGFLRSNTRVETKYNFTPYRSSR